MEFGERCLTIGTGNTVGTGSGSGESAEAVHELREWQWALYRSHAFFTAGLSGLGPDHETRVVIVDMVTG